jgi:hypothetical protein
MDPLTRHFWNPRPGSVIVLRDPQHAEPDEPRLDEPDWDALMELDPDPAFVWELDE